MKTVLASVSDKSGLVEFLKALQTYDDLRVIATGSTAKYLQDAGFLCESVESVTTFPEILDGRVKTLHPRVFGGILSKETDLHEAQLKEHEAPKFDYVIVNLYPFESVVKSGASTEDAVENIDIGGVALIRAAAKNHQRVVVIPGPEFYASVTQELQESQGNLSFEFRKLLARRAFEKTAYYDALIAAYFYQGEGEAMPNDLTLHFSKIQTLRYGENPHQQASWYQQVNATFEKPFDQLQGKEMSSNNLVDAYSAFRILTEFPSDAACCIIKHNNPCGVAVAKTIENAYQKAYAADPISAFGGVFGFNQTVTKAIAEQITQNFVEIIMAPAFDLDALELLAKKKNIRVLQVPKLSQPQSKKVRWVLRDMEEFGLILQENTLSNDLPELTTVTQQVLPDNTLSDVAFAWAIVKHLTSNAIVIVKNGQTVGFGIGQTSRIGSMEIALRQAGENANGAVLASDGFFPATDNIEAAAQAGISVIVQPGGSIKDPEVIEAADQHGLVMLMTHERCFKH